MKMRALTLQAVLATILLGGCATLPVLNAPPAPRTIAFLDGQNFALTEPMTFVIGSSGKSVTVPAGFVTDYASVPRSLQWMIGKQGRYSRATVLHDFLYWTQICSRKQSDNLLWIMMAQSGVPGTQRSTITDGVELGGGPAWKRNERRRADGLPRFLPVDRYGLANTLTWEQARAQLAKDGVKDPATTVDPAICALGDRRIVP